MPTFYECQRCAACCRWPGLVRITEEESALIARHLDLDELEFTQGFTRLRPSRDGLALIDKENGECVFLNDGQCLIQPVKPQQCRDFPNLWRNTESGAKCQATPREVPLDQYLQLVAAATGRSVESLRRPA